jgi:hypothetical protein
LQRELDERHHAPKSAQRSEAQATTFRRGLEASQPSSLRESSPELGRPRTSHRGRRATSRFSTQVCPARDATTTPFDASSKRRHPARCTNHPQNWGDRGLRIEADERHHASAPKSATALRDVNHCASRTPRIEKPARFDRYCLKPATKGRALRVLGSLAHDRSSGTSRDPKEHESATMKTACNVHSDANPENVQATLACACWVRSPPGAKNSGKQSSETHHGTCRRTGDG